LNRQSSISGDRCIKGGEFVNGTLFWWEMKKLSLLLLFTAWAHSVLSGTPDLDPTFKTGTGSNGFVEHVVPLDNGQILIAGNFTQFNDRPAAFVARLNEEGTLDASFKPQIQYWVRHLAVQPDGKIIIVGAFGGVQNQSRNLIARLNPDGSLDTSFNPGLGAHDKLTPSDPNPPYIFWCDLQSDGKILIVGSFEKYNGQLARGIARINSDGSLDTSFKIAPGLDSWGRFVRVLPNGKVIVTGWFTSFNGYGCNRMVLLNPDGTPDFTFHPFFGDKTSIYHALPIADGKWLVSGHSKNEQGLFHRGLARLAPDGTQEETFLAHTNERTEYLLTQPDGKILAFGWFTTANDQWRVNIARFHPDGALDNEFIANADNFVWSAAFDKKGRLLVAGGFINLNGTYTKGVARLVLDSPMPEPTPPSPPQILNTALINSSFELTLRSEKDRHYTLEYRDGFTEGQWQELSSRVGNGSELTLLDPEPAAYCRCYRVRVE
jgi:uncharacterized delta-60 repeat protein